MFLNDDVYVNVYIVMEQRNADVTSYKHVGDNRVADGYRPLCDQFLFTGVLMNYQKMLEKIRFFLVQGSDIMSRLL